MPPPPAFPCTHCTTTFSKHDKLQRHLLTAHHGQLCLSPDHPLPPSPLHTTISTALTIANAAFSRLPPSHPQHCPYCPDSHKQKPFRNAMDLSQHLVAKHDNLISPGTTADPPAQPIANLSQPSTAKPTPRPSATQTSIRTVKSEVSATHPANPPMIASSTTTQPKVIISKKRPNAAIHKADDATSPPRKQSRTNPPSKPLHKNPTTPSPASNTLKSNTTPPPKQSPTKNNPPSPTNTASGKKRRSSQASGDVALSATKPPITPKKKKDGSKSKPVPAWLLGDELRLPKQAAMTAAPLDFTWFGGLQANTHQGYYRLVDR
eukprot:GFKZ01005185.1.p1 GENE.GFKZ01005185.1~~GFKZ01005185.1.p1  ORF type:complete len:351 (-),score=28.63 GFKZ01005185.1:633-1592(-)